MPGSVASYVQCHIGPHFPLPEKEAEKDTKYKYIHNNIILQKLSSNYMLCKLKILWNLDNLGILIFRLAGKKTSCTHKTNQRHIKTRDNAPRKKLSLDKKKLCRRKRNPQSLSYTMFWGTFMSSDKSFCLYDNANGVLLNFKGTNGESNHRFACGWLF